MDKYVLPLSQVSRLLKSSLAASGLQNLSVSSSLVQMIARSTTMFIWYLVNRSLAERGKLKKKRSTLLAVDLMNALNGLNMRHVIACVTAKYQSIESSVNEKKDAQDRKRKLDEETIEQSDQPIRAHTMDVTDHEAHVSISENINPFEQTLMDMEVSNSSSVDDNMLEMNPFDAV